MPNERLPAGDLEHIFEHCRELWDQFGGKSLFLTGGTGFVGTWLLESLLWANDRRKLDTKVIVLTRDPDAYRERSPHNAGHRAVHLLRGDTSSFAFPSGEIPFVVHAATEPQISQDALSPLGAFNRDIEGTRRVLEFARSQGVRRLLFTSSGAVYGRQPTDIRRVTEAFVGAPSAVDPATAYGQAKRVSEFMCVSYGKVYRFDALVARLFAFVGPLLPLDKHYAIGNFIRDALAGGPIRIAGDGTPYRSYLYAADLAIWIWTILLRGKAADPYNVGSSSELTIRDLARHVASETALDGQIEIAREADPAVSPSRYVPCVHKAAADLGLRPNVSLRDGIARTVSWHRMRNTHA